MVYIRLVLLLLYCCKAVQAVREPCDTVLRQQQQQQYEIITGQYSSSSNGCTAVVTAEELPVLVLGSAYVGASVGGRRTAVASNRVTSDRDF